MSSLEHTRVRVVRCVSVFMTGLPFRHLAFDVNADRDIRIPTSN